jgi:hypothetical protein
LIEKIDNGKLEQVLVAPTSVKEDEPKKEESKLDEVIGGAITDIKETPVQGVDALAEKTVQQTDKQEPETMNLTFEIAVPVMNQNEETESSEDIKAKIVDSIRKMGYNPEKYKISVEQVEVDDDFVVPLKVYRVKLTSKERVRVLRFKIQKSDIEKLIRLYKQLKKIDADEVLTLLVTKIQAYLKKKGYAISNLVKNDSENYAFIAVFNEELLAETDREDIDKEAENSEEETDFLNQKNWNLLLEDFKEQEKPKEPKEVKPVTEITGGCWGYGWGRGWWAYRPYYWRRGWYGGNEEKVNIDLEVSASLECSSKTSAFKAKATGLPMALDVIIETDAEYKKSLENRGFSLLVVKFQQKEKANDGYRPVAFDSQNITFDEKLNANISRVVVDADSGFKTYVFYLFVKSKDLKDFDKDPEAVNDKLSIKLRASVVVSQQNVPI